MKDNMKYQTEELVHGNNIPSHRKPPLCPLKNNVDKNLNVANMNKYVIKDGELIIDIVKADYIELYESLIYLFTKDRECVAVVPPKYIVIKTELL